MVSFLGMDLEKRVIFVALRQGHEQMQVFGQYANGIQDKWCRFLGFAEGMAQGVYMANQQVLFAVLQYQGEKVCTAPGFASAVTHGFLFCLF